MFLLYCRHSDISFDSFDIWTRIMKKTAGTKSSFHKLYLIDSEIYNRILPHLNEIDKQETNDLNYNNRPLDDMMDEPKEKEQHINNHFDVVMPNENNEKITRRDITPEMKAKKFACEICVNKKFTTKQSLKRHHKTFHEKKQSIKEIYPEIGSPQIEEKTAFSVFNTPGLRSHRIQN